MTTAIAAPAPPPAELWAWPAFVGSKAALKYARRDLPVLEAAIALAPGRTAAIQAGGNLGIYPKRLALAFETVYTFEPAAELIAAMAVNAPEPNIIRIQAALGERRELVGLSRDRRDGKPGAHEGITHIAGPGTIPTLQIDDLALPVCDLIQLDLEGWELYALRGARATLARCRPILLVEVNKNLGYLGISEAAVRAEIAAAGYRFAWRAHSDEAWLPIERAA